MRLALLSDVHGNLAALEAVLADLEAHGPFDGLGVAGDLCEWGPQPREVLRRVQELRCPVVRGNTDRNIAIADEAVLRAMGKSDRAIAALTWTRTQIGADGVAYLAALPFAHTYGGPDGQDVLMVHANPTDLDTPLLPDTPPDEAARLLGGSTATVVAFGHIHTPYVRVLDRRILVDVASVGYPCDGDTRAAYATLEWDGAWRAFIHRVPYDLARTAAAFTASGIPRPKKRIKALYHATH